ncbi:MAG: PorT family protein [Paludibacteraceae bacterium]|nr:PorT family protein [Paludibacteraceae bacterium]
MKKIVFLLLTLNVCLVVNAQRVGLEGSYVGDILYQKEGGKSATDYVSGWNAGFMYEQFFVKERGAGKWSLETGLLWEMRGGRYGIEWYQEATTCTRFMHYVEVPLNVNRYFVLGKESWKLKAFAFGGPRLYVGTAGKYGNHYYLATRPYKRHNPYNDKFSGRYMHRFDAQLGIGGGVEWHFVRLKVEYDFPLTNSSADGNPDYLYQHGLKVGLGLRLDLRRESEER